jgi:hypothetical protein
MAARLNLASSKAFSGLQLTAEPREVANQETWLQRVAPALSSDRGNYNPAMMTDPRTNSGMDKFLEWLTVCPL